MNQIQRLYMVPVLIIIILLPVFLVRAQDPAKVAKDVYKTTTDNEHVRVLDIRLKPGGKSPMHSHPAYIAIALTPCKVKFTAPNGKSQEVELKPGEAVWRDAETHSVDNVGGECHALNIELKRATKKGN
ncbi:MAG TPA: cytoplasmic protein [Candidatus Binatia bacterium]|jgi:quercetin dioxygenase-like cupin family protein